MDNLKHDNLTANDIVPGVGGVIDKGASAAKDVVVSIRNRAKAKEAQRISDAGGYWTLRPFLKSLIPVPQYVLDQVAGQGITEYAVKQLPAQQVGSSNATIINALKAFSGTTSDATINPTGNPALDTNVPQSAFQKYLPYIAGAVVLALAIYFIRKK